jgi:putative ABC transport system substrate-binding protein
MYTRKTLLPVKTLHFNVFLFGLIIYLSRMKFLRVLSLLIAVVIIASCSSPTKNNIPVVGFIDAFEDATISQAKTGFIDALKKNGFSEEQKTVVIKYNNAQGSIPTLTQMVNQLICWLLQPPWQP